MRMLKLDELIKMIDEPNRSLCSKIYLDNKEIFDKAKGSKTKHQSWDGGYMDHIIQVMNFAVKQYEIYSFTKLDFSLSDLLLVLYLHDLEKPWKYGNGDIIENQKEFIEDKINEYGFELTDNHWNGLKYVHGEGDDYDPNIRVQSPLSAMAHTCDVISARVFFDYKLDE